jgi:probable phosphoglycerate mutase
MVDVDNTAAPTIIYLIRHGQIAANVERRWHGSTNSPLNSLGEMQASRLGRHLKKQRRGFSAIYTSPLQRTYRTAELVGQQLGVKPIPVDGLVEFGIGDLENTLFDDLLNKIGFFREIEADIRYAPAGGESVHQVMLRMVAAIESLTSRPRGEEIAIVSHGAAIGIALAQMLDGSPYPFYKYHMDNTGLSKLSYTDKLEMIDFNVVEHLQEDQLQEEKGHD